MSEGREIVRGYGKDVLSPTLFNIYLKDLMKNCFLNTGGVNSGGRRIKCIRFADYMSLLAEDERMLKNMLMELNRCEDYGMKINKSKTKAMVIRRKPNKIDIRIKDESVEQVDSFRYLGCNISSNLKCFQKVKQSIAMAK